MRLIRKGHLLDILACAALVSLVALAASTTGSAPRTSAAAASTPISLRAQPGQMVRFGGLFVAVPPRGQSVVADTLSTDGRERGLILESRPDGTVLAYEGAALEARLRVRS